MFCEFGNARMARTEAYKLIRRYPYAGVTFDDDLYDLRADPRETVNLHKEPSLKNVIRDLSNESNLFFRKYTVPGRSGLALKGQPECNPYSPWLLATR